MKVTPTDEHYIPSIIEMAQAASPEAIRAQRMQELKDLAEYRARKLQAYKDWADPVKRAAIQAKYEKDRAEAWQEVAGKEIEDYKIMGKDEKPFFSRIKLKEFSKKVQRQSLFERLIGWFK